MLRAAKRIHGAGVTLARKGYDVEPCTQAGGEYLRVTIWIYFPGIGKIDTFVGLV